MSFKLDEWLLNLGLWRSASQHVLKANRAKKSLSELTENERRRVLSHIDFSKTITFTRADFDENGYRPIILKSDINYDKKTGVFEGKITYWRHLPYENNNGQAKQKQSVLEFRAIREADQGQDNNPTLMPYEINIDGETIFSLHGDDPEQARNYHMVERVTDLFQLTNQLIQGRLTGENNQPLKLRDAKKVLSGTTQKIAEDGGDILGEATGKKATLAGLNPKGGFAPASSLHFYESAFGENQPIRFSDMDEAMLDTVMGFTQNTLDTGLDHSSNKTTTAVIMHSGVRYRAEVKKEKKGRTIAYSLQVNPYKAHKSKKVPPGFEVARIEFKENDAQTFELKSASIMNGNHEGIKTYTDRMSVLGLFQDANQNYIAHNMFPPFGGLFAKYKLNGNLPMVVRTPGYVDMNGHEQPNYLNAMGGEFLWIPLFGSSVEKKVAGFGDEVGNCHVFLSRGLKDDHTISESAIIFDVMLANGGPDKGASGMIADITPWLDAVRNGGYIVLSHDHYDHKTIEHMIQKGWLKDVKIICTNAVKYVVDQTCSNLNVSAADKPVILPIENMKSIKYNHSQIHDACAKMGVLPKDKTIEQAMGQIKQIPITDQDGKTRMWLQLCKNGSLHTAETMTTAITPAYGNKITGKPFYTASDHIELTEEGRVFTFALPQILAQEKNVEWRDLAQYVYQKDGTPDYFVSLDEVTGINSGGSMRPEDFRETAKVLAELDKELGMTPFNIQFSTNILEILTWEELYSLNDYLRNTVFVGANIERRARIMNKFGADPSVDLTKIDIPKDKIPLQFYDQGIDALGKYLEKEKTRLEKTFDTSDEEKEAFNAYKKVYEDILEQKKLGDPKPQAFYEAYMNGYNDPERRSADENAVRKAFQSIKKQRKEKLEKDTSKESEHLRDVHFFIAHELQKNGSITFKKDNLDARAMYIAIMNDQAKAKSTAGRTSKKAKSWRDDPEFLALFGTGPTGIAEEKLAQLYRFGWFNSLIDFDERVRKTSYEVDSDNLIINVTQPSPPSKNSVLAQEALMQMVANNRNVPIRLATRNGFKVINPGATLKAHEKKFRQHGWSFEPYDAAKDEIFVNRPFHIHGHPFFNDIQRETEESPSRIHVPIHIPNYAAFAKHREMVSKIPGKVQPIEFPRDNVSYRAEIDPQTQDWRLVHMDSLPERFILIHETSQYRKPFKPDISLQRAVLLRADGNNPYDALNARLNDRTHLDSMPTQRFNESAAGSGHLTNRQGQLGPATADIQPIRSGKTRAPNPPRVPVPESTLRAMRD